MPQSYPIFNEIAFRPGSARPAVIASGQCSLIPKTFIINEQKGHGAKKGSFLIRRGWRVRVANSSLKGGGQGVGGAHQEGARTVWRISIKDSTLGTK